MARDGSNNTLNVVSGHSRRRSMSLGSSSGATLLAVGRSSPSSSPQERQQSNAKTNEEAERLRSELQRWKLDLDGVLGSIGDGSALTLSPDLANGDKRTSAPPSPNIGTLPTFEPLGMPFSQRPLSTPAVMSGPASHGSPRKEVRANSDPQVGTLTPRPKTTDGAPMVPTPIIPSPMVDVFREPSDTSEDAPEAPVKPPSIRLVSPATSATELSDDVDTIHLDSNGLGLQTITESSPSPDATFSTPAKPAASNPIATPEATGVTPLLFTQSPSPVAARDNDTSVAALNRKLARHSIIANSSRPNTASRTTSTSSLQSDAMGRGLSKASTDGSSGGEDGPHKMDLSAGAPLEERAKSFAQRCWVEDETFLEPRKIAEWLGSSRRPNAAALRIYIEYFDFTGLRLDMAFRRLCEKLLLRAEAQQLDRIIEQFGRRYYENNPGTVYESPDVVHAVAYSLLLLNTDLHIARTASRMTRHQFVNNTVKAIVVMKAQKDPEEASTGLLFGGSNASQEQEIADVFTGPEEATSSRMSLDRSLDRSLGKAARRRSATVSSWKTSRDTSANSSMPDLTGSPVRPRIFTSASTESSPARTRANSGGNLAHMELESNLKEMYTAIKAQPFFQPQQSNSSTTMLNDGRSSVSLAPATSPYGSLGSVSRSASRRSAASTLSAASNAYKRSSIRGLGSFLGGGSSADFTRSSSPTPSTATSFSEENQSMVHGHAHHNIPTIGFANSLSHTIIREQQEDDAKSEGGASVTDEELALLGAPWAKEGILHRKHYWESPGRRAKEKHWLQVFVSTAQSVGEISLTHALSSAMPPPGYSKDRPHCFVLTLPNGGSYFFQAGTPDLVSEWVATCNYWSARLSKEPLSGGVSNMEYGWNRVDVGDEQDDGAAEVGSIRSGRSGKSGHSRMSHHPSFVPSSHGNPNDRIHINDWKPPGVPTGSSTLSEDAQLESLKRHVSIIRNELAVHNQLHAPMLKLYSSRSANLVKASANWKAKSQHLLSEMVKYQTYVDNLSSALRLKAIRRGQKEVEDMLNNADLVDVEETDEQPDLSSKPALRLDPDRREVEDSEGDEFYDPGAHDPFR
ncbi:SEC7-like domain containing protein [Pseudohyphozyma bogoriensis]|nr:SEC7-like domain containing protein [Pseudohyphozyma bogoriensis]